MATVEVISPRTIRAKRILRDLTGEELRELARPGEKTSEYGSPVYSTRVKNRSAKNTYVVSNRVPIGVMQQPIERDRAEERILRARLERAADLPGRGPGLHVHPRDRLSRRSEEVDAPAGDVLDQAARWFGS